MRSPAMAARHRASASVARMMLVCFRAMTGDFAAKNIAAMMPELLIAMVVRVNDESGLMPISISSIARLTGIPRRSVTRRIERLIQRGVVLQKDGGITGNDGYLKARIDAAYFRMVVEAIRNAARELENF